MLGVLWLAGFSAFAGNEQVELEQVRTRIKQVTTRLNADKAEQDSVQDQLTAVEREMAGLNHALHETESQIRAGRRAVKEYEAEERRLRNALSGSRLQLRRLLYAGYVAGRAEYLKLLLNQEDPGRLGRNLSYYRYLSRRRADDIVEVERTVGRLAALKSTLKTKNEELKALAKDQLSRQEDLRAARIERGVLLNEVRQRIGSREEELGRLKRREARLKRLLTDLKNALSDLPPGSALDHRFGDMRGKLSLPIHATISASFGQSKGKTGLRWDGVFLTADEGTVVRSIFPGRVAFADWLRGYGLLLILDHGDGYMSLYSHNRLLYRQVGEWVDAGEPIAEVGTSGGLSEPGLYFEVRHNGEPHNPLIWCKVE